MLRRVVIPALVAAVAMSGCSIMRGGTGDDPGSAGSVGTPAPGTPQGADADGDIGKAEAPEDVFDGMPPEDFESAAGGAGLRAHATRSGLDGASLFESTSTSDDGGVSLIGTEGERPVAMYAEYDTADAAREKFDDLKSAFGADVPEGSPKEAGTAQFMAGCDGNGHVYRVCMTHGNVLVYCATPLSDPSAEKVYEAARRSCREMDMDPNAISPTGQSTRK